MKKDVSVRKSKGSLFVHEIAKLPEGNYLIANIKDPENLIPDNYRKIDTSDKEYLKNKTSIMHEGMNIPIHLWVEDGKVRIKAGHTRTQIIMDLREIDCIKNLHANVDVAPIKKPSEDLAAFQERLLAARRSSSVTAVTSNFLYKKPVGIEKAHAIAKLMEETGMNKGEAAEATGFHRKTIERSLNILLFPNDIKNHLWENAAKLKEADILEAAAEYKAYLKSTDDKAEKPSEETLLAKAQEILKKATEPKVKSDSEASMSVMKVDMTLLMARLAHEKIPDSTVKKVVAIMNECAS